jgi:hypothetical protein
VGEERFICVRMMLWVAFHRLELRYSVTNRDVLFYFNGFDLLMFSVAEVHGRLLV